VVNENDLYKSPVAFKQVKLTKSQEEVREKVCKLADMFFSSSNIPDFKINGFLLYGKPQNGKTETVKQICRSLYLKYRDIKVAFLDSSTILYGELGISEKLINSIFNPSRMTGERKIIFFDDIDCLFFGRENVTSQTWHISMSSVMFHCLDSIDPRNTLFIATSNKKELLDFAMQSRLLQIEMKLPTKEELEVKVAKMVNSFKGIDKERREDVISRVTSEIVENETGFRDIQYSIARYIAEV
jgi:SpoVK/Ycf46/Vps4 family AAA+-type ATPase